MREWASFDLTGSEKASVHDGTSMVRTGNTAGGQSYKLAEGDSRDGLFGSSGLSRSTKQTELTRGTRETIRLSSLTLHGLWHSLAQALGIDRASVL